MISLLMILASLAYGLSLVVFYRERAVVRETSSELTKPLLASCLGASAVHLLYLLMLNRLDVFASLSWVSALMALLTAVWLLPKREHFLPGLSAAIALISILVLALAPTPKAVRDIAGWQIQLHSGIALLAYAILSLAGLQALLLWLAETALRSLSGGDHWVQKLWRLIQSWVPPISRLERQLFQLIGLGLALLTLTLLSGSLFIRDWLDQNLVHKTVLTMLSWLVFVVLLLGHWRLGWRGKQAALATLVGMFLLLLAFFGSKVVLELILQRS